MPQLPGGGGGAGDSVVPQPMQKVAPSALAEPHFGQITVVSYRFLTARRTCLATAAFIS